MQLPLFDAAADAAAPPRPPWRRHDDGAHRFDYLLQRSRRRTIGIRVDERGVVVAAPNWVALRQVQQFLADKAGWVARQLALRDARRAAQHASRIDWRDGGELPYLGRRLTLRVAAAATVLHGDELRLALSADAAPQQLRDAAQAWLQREARALFAARCAHYAQQLGVQPRAVRLSSASTRWGSASRDGTLRLHWRLLHFTPQLIDYVIAHEVAHLREMNHGERFWAAVGELFPDWRDARAQLRASVLPPW
jgi:predicted metal-dependent hydrolase